MKHLFVLLALLGAGCTQGTDLLTSVGVSAATAATIASDTAAVGQLFCTDGVQFVAVAGATVTGATADKVAKACAAASVAGALTPAAAPTGTVAQLVSIAPVVLAALDASKVQ